MRYGRKYFEPSAFHSLPGKEMTFCLPSKPTEIHDSSFDLYYRVEEKDSLVKRHA